MGRRGGRGGGGGGGGDSYLELKCGGSVVYESKMVGSSGSFLDLNNTYKKIDKQHIIFSSAT